MSKIFRLFVTMLLCGSAWQAVLLGQEDQEARDKYAVLIGVNEYIDLNGLNYTLNDIHDLKSELIDLGFAENHIYTLTSDGRVSERPTKELIEKTLRFVLESATRDDFVLLAFSGHGLEIGSENYFCPENASRTDWASTCVSLTEVMKLLEKSPARFKLMIVDACRENPFLTRNTDPNVTAIQEIADPPKGIAFLMSCAAGEMSHEDDQLKHGVFTHYLLEGLRGGADTDSDGVVTFLDLVKYTDNQTKDYVFRRFKACQRPFVKLTTTDFVISRRLGLQLYTPENCPEPTMALEEAIRRDDVEQARRNISLKRDIDKPFYKRDGRIQYIDITPIQQAIMHKNIPMIKLLFQGGADLNEYGYVSSDEVVVSRQFGEGIVSFASMFGNPEILEFLEKKGINIQEEFGQNSLFCAARGGNWENFQFLLSRGMSLFSEGLNDSNLMFAAAYGGNMNIIRYCFKQGLKINIENTNGETPLFEAARGGHLDAMRFFVDRGCDPTKKESKYPPTLLDYAAINHNIEAMRYLINLGLKPDHTTLKAAIESGDIEAVKFILDRGVSLRSPELKEPGVFFSPLFYGDLKMTDYLIRQGASLKNIGYGNGDSPLFCAHDAKTVQYLFDKGFSATVRDNRGNTPIHDTEYFRGDAFEVVQLYLKKGVNIETRNNEGETPLLTCGIKYMLHINTAKALVQAGAAINAKDNDGLTLLDRAETVRDYYLDENKNNNINEIGKKFAEHNAASARKEYRKAEGFIEYLKEHGAKRGSEIR